MGFRKAVERLLMLEHSGRKPGSSLKAPRYRRSLREGMKDIADSDQETVFEIGVGHRHAGHLDQFPAAVFQQFALVFATGEDERMSLDLEPDRGPVLEPHIFSGQKQFEPGF